MKYESAILKRLIDTYGVVGNPRYISEIIKEFIVRGKERYPNLFTYQSDWLAHIDEFGLNPTYTVSYTGQSIYAPNTLERPVKSAILSGQTLVNVIDFSRWGEQEKITLVADGTAKSIGLGMNLPIKPSTKYLTIIPVYENTINSCFTIGGWNYYEDQPRITSADGTGIIKIIKTTRDAFPSGYSYLELWQENTSGQITFGKPMMIEYQEGMENWDIPFFEGMQSVKMPVLTTTGKNLLNMNDYGLRFATTFVDSTDNSITFTTTEAWGGLVYDFYLKPNQSYHISFESPQTSSEIQGFIRLLNTSSSTIGGSKSYSFTTDSSGSVRLTFETTTALENVTVSNIQIEEGDIKTSYEPYKSNILSTPSDLELRGIGEVKDELNLLTGELTQRVGEIVLDGSEGWSIATEGDTTNGFSIYTSITDRKLGANVLCEQLPVYRYDSEVSGKTNFILAFTDQSNVVVVNIANKTTKEEAIAHLKQNPIKLQIVKEPVIKTVDLSILDQNGQNVKQLMSFNGGTHFNTGSSEGSLLPSISVSVETDLEETLMMCSLEGNTL